MRAFAEMVSNVCRRTAPIANRRTYLFLSTILREILIAFVVGEQRTPSVVWNAEPAAKTAMFKPAQTI